MIVFGVLEKIQDKGRKKDDVDGSNNMIVFSNIHSYVDIIVRYVLEH